MDTMPVRLLFTKLPDKVLMIFWLMDMKLAIIDFQLPITNPSLQEILT